MAQIFGIDHKYFVIPIGVVTGGVAIFSTWKLLRLKRRNQKENVYETQKSLNEYLLFHYGSPKEILLQNGGPTNGFNFPKRCADLCMSVYSKRKDASIPNRALDIGCSVGAATFQMTKAFDKVVGIDYSKAFIDACNTMKGQGTMKYSMVREGELCDEFVAQVDSELDRSKADFRVGDACNLPLDLGQFGCVLAANLICRLQTPQAFFDRLRSLLAPGGILVITSPYTFLPEFTPRDNMIGAIKNADGTELTALDGMKKLLEPQFQLISQEDMPFLIRETARKHQWTVAHATVWVRQDN